MLCSVTHNGIDEMISDPSINASTSCFKFVISDELINYIENKYQADQTRLSLFRSWVSSRFQQKSRLRYIASKDISKYYNNPKNEEIFISCALFSGHFLFGANDLNIEHYNKNGISVHDIKHSHKFHGTGDNPIHEERLINNDTKTPIDIMKYFIGEREIIFIDNYFNPKALSFVEYIADGLDTRANITIITKKASLLKLPAQTILSSLSRGVHKHHINIYTLVNDKEFHDRHIAIGKRLLIDASAGLDGYSYRGEWNNRECKFSVYDVYENYKTRIFDAHDAANNKITISINMPV